MGISVYRALIECLLGNEQVYLEKVEILSAAKLMTARFELLSNRTK
jgi:hypothetical protein